jgi:hypothetical protein
MPHVLSFALEEFRSARQSGLRDVSGPHRRRDLGAPRQGFARAAGEVRAQDDLGRMVGHDEPDRAALRHRSRPHPTKAVPNGDGSYAITGTKIFISAGEHDLTSNIIHLVLAKTPGAPDSTKGISLFVVPKFLLDDDGDPGVRNGVTCGSIEKKMGIHANSTCLLNYDGATGWHGGRGEQGPRGHVHHDERRASWRRHSGLCSGRSRLSECGELRARPAPGPCTDRPGRAGGQGRSDLRPPRRAPDADGRQGVHRIDARPVPVGRAPGRSDPQGADRGGARDGRPADRPADPGDQGLWHRQGL